ncbi:MAG: hypothetical protein IPM33_02105 [Phycisphaerales bacterium]|nr:hypothetical protein [Phycisphaerales bacterium]
MVFGILVILLACLINTCLVLLPGLVSFLLALLVQSFLHKVKMRSDSLDAIVFTTLAALATPFAAALQLLLWGLHFGEDAWRWSMAGVAYVLGAGVVLIILLFNSQNPFERAWAARRFMLGVILVCATLGLANSNQDVYEFVSIVPFALAKFLFGGGNVQ